MAQSQSEPTSPSSVERARQERCAVIDIGSNSIRLVIYDGPKRAPFPVCNEKALCGLGRDMREDGTLDPAAVDYALATLLRFRRLIDAHGSPPVHAIATAAVREARDGAAFLARVSKIGFDVRMVGGPEEAELAALGVVSYEPGATGVVGDMGGGSLELISVNAGEIGERISLSIGPLRLMQQTGGKIAPAADIVAAALDGVDWLNGGRYEALYSVGGAWRAVARIHMGLRRYPLSVLHHYEFSVSDALAICNLVAKQSRRSLEEIPGIPRRRIDTLPFAALVLRGVLQRTGAGRVVVSAGGVREGLLFSALDPQTRREDPLLSGCRFFAERLSPDPASGAAVARLTEALFSDEDAAGRRLRIATCALIDIGAYFHPDLRAEQAFDTALRAPFYGVSHAERIAIALSLFWRHEGRRPMVDEHVLGLVPWDAHQRAVQLGLAMRFASALAPKAPDALAACSLAIADGVLTFRAPEATRELMGELPRKRLEALAAAFDAAPAESYF